MSVSNDLDPHLIKCIGLLYESRKLRKGDPVPLQYILEDAIFEKTGVVKDYTDFFQSQLPVRENEDTTIITTTAVYEDDVENNSDNDLELDLFKDDLSCVMCNKMDVGARNRLLECKDCHALYHQECHKPVVNEEDVIDNWTCSNCKSVSAKKSKTSDNKEHNIASKSSSSSGSKSESHRHGGSSSSSSRKSSSDKYKSSSKSSSSSATNKSRSSSPSHSSSRSEDKKYTSKSSKSSKSHSDKRKHD